VDRVGETGNALISIFAEMARLELYWSL
jgi:hypothetical protein